MGGCGLREVVSVDTPLLAGNHPRSAEYLRAREKQILIS
jgi:hypothetical protein